MVLKAERERIKALLTEAITVLCKNGLGYKYTCGIEGLLGITLDDEDVFLVNINETIQGAERRPTAAEEETKESATAPQSPATASPSSTPRRRRRRSQDGQEGGSPAKRANYGDDQQQEPQNPDDVIVIKEEVSETEFSDFYGDTGGGNSQDGGQYAMPQGDQYGAGCSQWGDTSQTQGGQPEWPTFSPTQQQAAISQAASSAMMSPSQITGSSSMATLPSMRLRSKPVSDILSQQVIRPVMQNNWRVAAFRMCWNRQMDDTKSIWDSIVIMRKSLDDLVQMIPGSLFFISAINGTAFQSKAVEEGTYRASPGIVYWMVSRNVSTDQRALCNHMNSNTCGATLKLALQPYQTSEKDIRNALFSGVKDNMEGCVRRLVEDSCAFCYGPAERLQEPLVKVYVAKDGPRDMLTQAFSDLTAVRFRSEIVDMA